MSSLEVNKTQAYESKRKFQVSWVAKLPWVEHKDKLLALKWDSLQKHVNKKKVDKG
jgi:hypothetical protein